MEEYVCLTLLSNPGEEKSAFSARLSHFWTHLLRTRPDDFARVYAEHTAFEKEADGWTRQYLVEEEMVDLLERELRASGVLYHPVDRDEIFTKYEAAPPEWMQIEH